jgi:hypothetical protein
MVDKLIATDKEVLAMLTTTPSHVWGWPDLGKIETNYQADLVIAKADGPRDNFSELNPQDIILVLHQGEIRLFDEVLHKQLVNAGCSMENFHRIYLNGAYKYVQGDLPGLIRDIRRHSKSAEFPVTIPN